MAKQDFTKLIEYAKAIKKIKAMKIPESQKLKKAAALNFPKPKNERKELYDEAIEFGYTGKYTTIEKLKKYVDSKKPKVKKIEVKQFKDVRKDIQKYAEENKLNHFQVVLKSGQMDYEKPFTFNHLTHFENWADQTEAEGTSDSFNNPEPNPEKAGAFGYASVVSITPIAGGCNNHENQVRHITGLFYEFETYNPQSDRNQCFFKCLEELYKDYEYKRNYIQKLRKDLDIPKGKVTPEDAYRVADYFNMPVQIIDVDTNIELDEGEINYILLYKNHYSIVRSFSSSLESTKTKRGDMYFDFETRKTETYHIIKATGQKIYELKDALCCVYYRRYHKEEFLKKIFITNEKTSARQFLDFLAEENQEGRSYNIISHNGSNFDHYFMIKEMSSVELEASKLNVRGRSVIGMTYINNLFRDSCCFLIASLENLCDKKNFNIQNAKLTSFILNGKTITNKELCFYRPELTFEGFINLQHTDKEFWSLYEEYCMVDCISLSEIWTRFRTQINGMIEKINPKLLSTCALSSTLTVGSHSKKIVDKISRYIKAREKIEQFTREDIVFGEVKQRFSKEKHDFLRKFTQGGISHCEKGGKFPKNNKIVCYDVNSEYPASMIDAKVPSGESYFTDKYDSKAKGFYKINNIVFDQTQKFKPVAQRCDESKQTALNWAKKEYKEDDVLYVSSYMIKHLIQQNGLISFNVVQGLVSYEETAMSLVLGKYIRTLFAEKQHQDDLLVSKDELYNGAMRTVIKLYLNSLSGKLVEDSSRYFSINFKAEAEEKANTLNGVAFKKDYESNDSPYNEWLTCGIMVYDHSKRYFDTYINCVPNRDFIHLETDSIYFEEKYEEEFLNNVANYSGIYQKIFAVGDKLGNIKKECVSDGTKSSIFLGKKMYCLTVDGKDKMRIKGVPLKTITEDGKDLQIITHNSYEAMWRGETVKTEFKGLKKVLFGKTNILAVDMCRNIKATNMQAINRIHE